MRIFVWNMLMQTHAETIVIFIYYAIGFVGLLLYVRAVSRPSDPRTTKYMLFFSFLLLLLASLGLYNGFIEKFIRINVDTTIFSRIRFTFTNHKTFFFSGFTLSSCIVSNRIISMGFIEIVWSI